MMTGSTGLWKLGQKTSRLALSWKFMEDLAREGVGNNEVELRAWKRSANREVKKGKEWPKLDTGRYDREFTRDRKYVRMVMKTRAEHAKEDWIHVRKEFMNQKNKALKEAKDESERNEVKRMIRKLKKHNEQKFIEGRQRHSRRLLIMKENIRSRQVICAETLRRQELQELRSRWMQEIISKEEPPQPPPEVPTYGQVKLDSDEIACCLLGPKFNNYPFLIQKPKPMKVYCVTRSPGGPGSRLEALKTRRRTRSTLGDSRSKLRRMS